LYPLTSAPPDSRLRTEGRGRRTGKEDPAAGELIRYTAKILFRSCYVIMSNKLEAQIKLHLTKPLSIASIGIGFFSLLFNLFEPHVVAKFPEYIIGPALYGLIRSVIIGTIIILIVSSFFYAINGFSYEQYYSLIPLIINVFSIIIVIFVPLSSIWPDRLLPTTQPDNNLYRYFFIFKYKDTNYAELDKHWDEYNDVIDQIENGTIKVPNEDYGLIELPVEYQHLSQGGGEIVYEKKDDYIQIFFYTFRGVLDNFSGYMYKPDDKQPNSDDFLGDWKQIIKERPYWYYCSSY